MMIETEDKYVVYFTSRLRYLSKSEATERGVKKEIIFIDLTKI